MVPRGRAISCGLTVRAIWPSNRWKAAISSRGRVMGRPALQKVRSRKLTSNSPGLLTRNLSIDAIKSNRLVCVVDVGAGKTVSPFTANMTRDELANAVWDLTKSDPQAKKLHEAY